MYITDCDRCKEAQLTILSYERSLYLVRLLQKILVVLIICLFVTPLSHILETLWDVNVPWDTFFILLSLLLFRLTAQKNSGELSGVANCAAIKAKWGRQLPCSNIKDEKIKDFFLRYIRYAKYVSAFVEKLRMRCIHCYILPLTAFWEKFIEKESNVVCFHIFQTKVSNATLIRELAALPQLIWLSAERFY
jgi:hypothetical protein